MSKKDTKKTEKDIQEEMLELVKARLGAIPDNVRISIGEEDYSKEDIIRNVENKSDLGMDFVEMQMEYLRDLSNGSLYASQ